MLFFYQILRKLQIRQIHHTIRNQVMSITQHSSQSYLTLSFTLTSCRKQHLTKTYMVNISIPILSVCVFLTELLTHSFSLGPNLTISADIYSFLRYILLMKAKQCDRSCHCASIRHHKHFSQRKLVIHVDKL